MNLFALDFSKKAKKANVSERQAQKISLKVLNRWPMDVLQTHEESG